MWLLVKNFFNSEFFIALITLFVGGFAIYLYKKQKKDYKRNAARLILQEIRYAEQKIRRYREVKNYKLYDKLLPTNSWNDNIHLFIKELKETQIDLISDFYAKTSYIDTLIATISRQKNNPPIISLSPQSSFQQPTVPRTPGVQPTGNSRGPIQPHPREISLLPLPVSQKILGDVSMNIEFIYNTSVVERLRKVSEKKWYHFFYSKYGKQ